MREAAKEKMGFFPLPEEAIGLIVQMLRVRDVGETTILDPCAGEGSAILSLARELRVPVDNLYAIEVDSDRSRTLSAKLKTGNVLAEASFFGSDVGEDYSIIYCNPPFGTDHEHGRIETSWMIKCAEIQKANGTMVFICPEATFNTPKFFNRFAERYRMVSVVPFPASSRKHGEVVVVAFRKDGIYPGTRMDFTDKRATTIYPVRQSCRPSCFEKKFLNDKEISELVRNSPLNKTLFSSDSFSARLKRPPLPLHTGHMAMLLACGQLDGIVRPSSGADPHVIRGTAVKVENEKKEEREELSTEQGTVTTQKFVERIEIVVRMACSNGQILTLKGGGDATSN